MEKIKKYEGPEEIDWAGSSIKEDSDENTPLIDQQNQSLQESGTLVAFRIDLWSCQGIRQYVLIEVVVFLYFLSIVTSVSITQYFLFDKIAEKYSAVNISGMHPCEDIPKIRNSTASHIERKIQKETTHMLLYLTCATAFPAILPTLFMGGLSDRYGRKLVLLIALSGSLIRAVVYAVVIHLKLNINYLFIGNCIEGATGSYGTCLMAMFSLIADITQPGKSRAIRITALEAMLATSSATALLIAGFWIPIAGFFVPMLFSTMLLVMAFLFTSFCIPETLKPHNRVPFNLATLKRCVQLYTKDTANRRRWKLWICMISFFVIISVGLSKMLLMTLFLLNKPFCWQQTKINLVSAVQVLVNWVIILGFLKCFGHRISERMPGILGCISNTGSLILWGLATKDVYIYASSAVGILADVTTPVLRSMMSHQVSADEQGILFASVGVIELTCTAIMGLVATIVYNLTLDFFSGFVFLCMAILVGFVLILLIILDVGMKRQLGSSVIRTVNIEQHQD
ncbi:proton-coupled folate transporter [Patella vulgata]|uniref:proton-coupled folate transporter n=1 Tax=Patella vulgata TaxID=6465 RepID=UPI002180444A|nr:proton-coupled folate transporter [Patella vulgata]